MLKYGIVGCGMMGQEHLRNIALLPDVEVAAILEPDAEQAARAQAIAPHAQQVADLAAMAARPDLDALVIASPNFMHVDQLRTIYGQCAKPLLVEKPVMTRADEAATLMGLTQDRAAPIWVAMEYRYMPPLAAFLSELDSVTGGVKMLSIREHRFPFLEKVNHWNRFNAQTGGTLVEKCRHFFDLMRLVMGSEPFRISASGGQAVNHRDETYGGATPDIWDNAYVIVDFTCGGRAMLDLCMFAEGARFQEEICAIGPAGKLEARVPGPTRFWPGDAGPAPVAELELSPRFPKSPEVRAIPVPEDLLEAGDHNGATFYQHQKFAAVVAGRAQPEVTLDDGIRAVSMGLAAQEAARDGKVVVL
ncbi:MAG: Gfo/Idh/MocA family oxidoreductase [Pseudomonadota bacterium]